MQALKNPSDMPETGNWGHDNELGRNLAIAHIAAAREARSPVALVFTLQAMAETGRWTGIEVGFACALAMAALDMQLATA